MLTHIDWLKQQMELPMKNIPEALREFAMAERKRQGTMLNPVFEADLAMAAADEIEKLRAALAPLASKKIPEKVSYNAGAYSFLFSEIAAAKAALQ